MDKWFIITLFHDPTTGAISNHIIETKCSSKEQAEKYFDRFAKMAVSFKAEHGIDISVCMLKEKDWTKLKSQYNFKETSRNNIV